MALICRCLSGRRVHGRLHEGHLSGERHNSEIGKSRTIPGSFSDLIASYYRTPGFNNLAPITRRTYRNDIERFRTKHGEKRVAGFTTDHIERLIAGGLINRPRPTGCARRSKF